MNHLSRREFISKSVIGLAGASVLAPQLLHGKNENSAPGLIGFQSWAVKDTLGKDLSGTLKMMAGLGYNSVEMCSPPSYSKYGFGALQSLKASEMKRIINDAGMTCVSCHYQFDELKNNLQERIDFAKELGLTQMVLSAFGVPEKATLSDWKKAADDLNKVGEKSKKAGMQMCYHNHNMEFDKLEGQLIYDVLLNQFDPAVIKMQFQVWVISIGYKAADYFRKYPGRFISAHLYDWSGVGEEMVPLGKGKVDWKEFFEASKTGGIKNTFVEMDMPRLKESATFLRNMV